jgi:hypothetical protein
MPLNTVGAAPVQAPAPTTEAPRIDWRKHLKVHPAADIFPLMRETDPAGFKALVEDIRTNGLRAEPVFWCEEGTSDVHLIDGRNRIDALADLGILGIDADVRDRLVFVKEWDGTAWVDSVPLYSVTFQGAKVEGDPYAIALSLNVHRRHLTAEKKHDLIVAVLKARTELSDRQIGKLTHSDKNTVAADRAALESRGEIHHVEARTDSKGRKQPATKRTRAAKVEAEVQAADGQNNPALSAGNDVHAVAEPTVEPGDVEDPAIVLTNVLDTIKQARGVAEAYRKILQRSPFDRAAKKEINDAIESLLRKWRSVQSTLAAKGDEEPPPSNPGPAPTPETDEEPTSEAPDAAAVDCSKLAGTAIDLAERIRAFADLENVTREAKEIVHGAAVAWAELSDTVSAVEEQTAPAVDRSLDIPPFLLRTQPGVPHDAPPPAPAPTPPAPSSPAPTPTLHRNPLDGWRKVKCADELEERHLHLVRLPAAQPATA